MNQEKKEFKKEQESLKPSLKVCPTPTQQGQCQIYNTEIYKSLELSKHYLGLCTWVRFPLSNNCD